MFGLGFLNIAMLIGTAAAVVPVLIHLLSRRRRRTINWGAMFLIEQVVRDDRRRVELKQWLLLALRCLILLLLALAMARPVMTHFRTNTAGDGPASVVVVLDASYSMSLADKTGISTFDRARDATFSVIKALPEGSDVTLVLAGDRVREVTPDVLKDVEPVAGPAQLNAAIAQAKAQLASATNVRREIIVITDALGGQVPPRDLNEQVPVTWLRLQTNPNFANVAVTSVAITPPVPVAGRPVRISATVTNTGVHDLSDVRVQLVVAGIVHAEQRMSVRAAREATTLFVHSFTEAGPHSLHITAKASDDALPADDSYFVALHLPQTLPTLLVAGETDRRFGENPGDFLAAALDPASHREGLPSLLLSLTIHIDDFDASRLRGIRVVVLADVPALTADDSKALREWIEAGGVLLAFAGANAQPVAYNEVMPVAAGGVLPATLAALRSDPTRFAAGPYNHPALAPWNEPESGDLTAVTINRRWTLSPSPSAASILRFQTGEPAFVVERIGRGSAMLAALPADGSWSDLPLRASFLPLIQQLVIDGLTATQSDRTLRTGDALVLDGVDEVSGWSVDMPNAARSAATVIPGSGTIRLNDTEQPGVYIVRFQGNPIEAFATNADRGESTLVPSNLGELAVVDGVAGWAALDRERRFGRDVWKPMWLLALLALFTELLLSGLFGREVSA